MTSERSRAWCWTLNNYSDEEFEVFTNAIDECDWLKYICCGKEVGKKNGTPHLQGFLYANNAVRLATLRRLFPRGRFAVCIGSPEQNIVYCSKDNEFFEYGVRPLSQKQKGKRERERYEEAWAAAVDGRMDDIPADIRVRHYHTVKRIRLDHQLQEHVHRLDPGTKMEWFYGPSGTGKSRTARDRWPDAYLKMCNKWWDGYNGQEVVLIEDFDVKHAVLIHHMKIWADIYPFLMEVKGAAAQIRPRLIVVTSNYHPSEIWSEDGDLQPILRRFQITHFESLTDSSATA